MAVAESPSTSPKTCEERDSRLSPGSIKLYGKKPANWGLLSAVSWDEARFTGLFLVWIFKFYLGHWSVCFNNFLHQLAWRCSLIAIHGNTNLVRQTPASAAHSKPTMFPQCVTILMTSLHLVSSVNWRQNPFQTMFTGSGENWRNREKILEHDVIVG